MSQKIYYFLLFFLLSNSYIWAIKSETTNTKKEKLDVTISNLLRFEENVGQLSKTVSFKANDAQATHFFMDGEIRTAIQGSKKGDSYIYAMEFMGISDEASYRALGGRRGQKGRRSYHTAHGSFADVPLHHRLEYNKLWEGVSAVFYERDGQMKYDFKVAPNADPSNIKLRLKGMDNVKINKKGELEFTTSLGTLSKGVPYTYQIIDGKLVEVEATYSIEGDVLSFDLGAYDSSLPLIIDPIALKWASFLEGGDWIVTDSYLDTVSGRLYTIGYAEASKSDFIGAHVKGTISSADVVIQCLEKDGSALLWTTIIGGSDWDEGRAIEVDENGDIFIFGTTSSGNFPMNSTIAGFDVTFNGASDAFVMRLDATGTTVKYASFIGTSGDNYPDFVNDLVLVDDVIYCLLPVHASQFGALPSPTYLSPHVSSREMGGVFKLNTGVAGATSLEGLAFIGDWANVNGIKKDGAGNIYISLTCVKFNDAMLTPNATQSRASIEAIAPNVFDDEWGIAFVAKFNPNLDELLFSTFVMPIINQVETQAFGKFAMEVSELGDIYVSPTNYFAIWPPLTEEPLYGPSISPIRDYSNINWLGGHSYGFFRSLAKIPVSNPSSYEFINIVPSYDDWYDNNYYDLALDKKGRIHFLNAQSIEDVNDNGLSSKVTTTAGAVVPTSQVNTNVGYVHTYTVFNPSGGLEYSTILPNNGESLGWKSSMHVEPESCTAYITSSLDRSLTTPLVTPSYRDEETGLQVNVNNTSPVSGSTAYIAVFHEPESENTINDFQAGNNTFCTNSLIYQNPDNGPILGEEPIYTSGDGSVANHNLPDLQFVDNGTIMSHPIPKSPNGSFLWQISRDNGTSWSDITGSTLSVLKPQPETSVGIVQYRRAFITGCCDTTYSNIATATIAGTFDMQINAPTEPVYYCPGTLTDLGINISNATGNISWQWYNGFDPITDAVITPASGTNVEQTAFTASIATTQNLDGFYRLVVTDAGGCKKEGFVFVSVLTAIASIEGNSVPLCPGETNSRTLGPIATNPAFDYQWSGPGGFSSTETNPEVTTEGSYTLQVALADSGTFCATGATTVEVTTAIPHDATLTTIPNTRFCQSSDPAAIGLSGTAPAGYVFQWSPGINIDNAQAYSPTFDPGILPFDMLPIAEVEYTFTALREDGCIFETTTMVTDTALAIANAGSDRPACDSTIIGKNTTTGLYYQWSAVSTTYPSGLATLIADSNFTIDDSNINLGTNYYAKVSAPLLNDGEDCYQVTYELQSSYVPFPTNCYAKDEVTVTYCCGTAGWCSEPTASLQGTDGVCSGMNNIVTVVPIDGLDIQWTTYSVDGVVQPAGTAPQGMFTVVDDAQGVAISAGGPHPSAVVANIDDATWGWLGANVVVYQVRIFGTLDGQTWDCSELLQVFSGINSTPVIGVLDKSLCSFPAPGTAINTGPGVSPYTVSGVDYTQAPNSSMDWQWTEIAGSTASIISGSTTPFPVLDAPSTTLYQVIVADPVTGCVAKDTMTLSLIDIVANAGSDISNVCAGSLVQLGTAAETNHTYSWSPTAGLNFPIGTLNNTTAQPYLLLPDVPSGINYTITSTETTTGCQATDEITITTDSNPPTAPPTATWNVCTSATAPSIQTDLSGAALVGHTYLWTVLAGDGDIAWFDDATAYEPTITVPQATASGTYTFRLTVTKGNCGSITQDYTLVIHDIPAIDLGLDVTPDCTTPYTALTTASDADYNYTWEPIVNLYTDDIGTNSYDGSSNTAYHTLYVAPSSSSNSYTITANHNSYTGCYATDMINVAAALPEEVSAGNSTNYCPSGEPIDIGIANIGVLHQWEGVGYNANPDSIPVTPSTGEAETMLTYLGSSTANETTFSQSINTAGIYVYRLTSTFANGCSDSGEVTIIVPNLGSGFAGSSQSVCEGESVQIGTVANTEYSYFWSALNPNTEANTINDTSLPQPTVTPAVTTIYQVEAINILTGCSVIENVGVTVTPNPNIDDVDMPTQCAPLAAAIDLTAQIPNYDSYFNPIWYQNSVPGTVVATPTAVTPTSTTDYYVVLENAEGCPATIRVTANIDNPQTPNVISAANAACDLLDLTDYQGTPSNPSYSLEWHNADNTDPSTLLSTTTVGAGTYYLFEKTVNGCFSSANVIQIVASQDCDPACPAVKCMRVIINKSN